MGDSTTLTIEQSTKTRLSAYRHRDHDNWTGVMEGMMEILPTVEDVRDGCVNCGEEPWTDAPLEEQGGVVRWWSTEYEGETIFGTAYFCSPECAAENSEEMQNHAPEEPDEVIIGGKSEMRTTVEEASFYIDGETMEVGLPVPGAFAGTSSHGEEYEYVDEPVYVYHEGDYRQHGVIEDIIHEETHTALLLGHSDYETVMLNHPDEERRSDYEGSHAKWTEEECASCGETVRFMVEEPPVECPNCDAEEW